MNSVPFVALYELSKIQLEEGLAVILKRILSPSMTIINFFIFNGRVNLCAIFASLSSKCPFIFIFNWDFIGSL